MTVSSVAFWVVIMCEMLDLRKEKASDVMVSSTVERMRSKVGAIALFKEGDWLSTVKLNQITANDNGAECLISSVPTAGLNPLPDEGASGIKLFASWSILLVDDLEWKAHYVAWYLFFEQELIQEIVALAAAEASNGRTLPFARAWAAVLGFWNREANGRRL